MLRIVACVICALQVGATPVAQAPTCATAGQPALCKTPCASTCRGFPPGFAAAGCIAAGDCANPPSWAKNSVCSCGAGPTPPPPTPTPPSPTPPGPAPGPAGPGSVGGYLLMRATTGMAELNALADAAASLPVNRVLLSFLSPTMVYEPKSFTLNNTGWDNFVFADIKQAIGKLTAGGVEVFLSLGGWNYNCYPYFYMRYSVGGYGTATPNYWKIQKYGGGDMAKCDASNQFCWVCEPSSEGTNLTDFTIFPEPKGQPGWEAAKAYVASKATAAKPVWNEDMVPGSTYTDKKTSIATTVPGSSLYVSKNRDPYADFVALANDLGASGCDLDYEEMWHADLFKTDAKGSVGGKGPWDLHQTSYKYTAILHDIRSNIASVNPKLKVSTASGAVGAWGGKWWGGNLKGVWLEVQKTFSEAAAGLIFNVMTYDLSKDEQFHECPDASDCPLAKQVDYYMKTYTTAGITTANVGYEVGTPAYPSPTHDRSNQLPLTTAALAAITSTTQKSFKGGFMWELFKPTVAGQASPTDTAQAICKVVTPGSARCTGKIPAPAY